VSSPIRRVLDASAVLALLLDEAGSETLRGLIEDAGISAVNWSEVLQKVYARAVDTSGLREALIAMRLSIVPFDANQADVAAGLWAATRERGLSLGDTACLALGRTNGVPVLTAERNWGGLDLGVAIQVIR
jgi:PIN domain nuclease of toxin-antitoxin system